MLLNCLRDPASQVMRLLRRAYSYYTDQDGVLPVDGLIAFNKLLRQLIKPLRREMMSGELIWKPCYAKEGERHI